MERIVGESGEHSLTGIEPETQAVIFAPGTHPGGDRQTLPLPGQAVIPAMPGIQPPLPDLRPVPGGEEGEARTHLDTRDIGLENRRVQAQGPIDLPVQPDRIGFTSKGRLPQERHQVGITAGIGKHGPRVMALTLCRGHGPHGLVSVQHVGDVITGKIALLKIETTGHRHQVFQGHGVRESGKLPGRDAPGRQPGCHSIGKGHATGRHLQAHEGCHQAFVHGPTLEPGRGCHRGRVALGHHLAPVQHQEREGIPTAILGLNEGLVTDDLEPTIGGDLPRRGQVAGKARCPGSFPIGGWGEIGNTVQGTAIAGSVSRFSVSGQNPGRRGVGTQLGGQEIRKQGHGRQPGTDILSQHKILGQTADKDPRTQLLGRVANANPARLMSDKPNHTHRDQCGPKNLTHTT